MKTGTEIPYLIHEPLLQAQLQAYAAASGDHNPIHLDEVAAKNAGLSGVVAHGMLTAAFIADRASRFAVSEAAAGVSFRVTRVKTRFRAMTQLGDKIAVGGRVKEASEARLVLELVAKNQRGEVTTSGVVELARVAPLS